MALNEKIPAIQNTAGEVVKLINDGTEWVNRYLKDKEKIECRYELKRCRRQIKKVKAVVGEKPAVALFGASQVGKSYMANNLLYDSNNKLEVYNHQDGETIDFIKYINPEGKGNEATGAVTRFASDPVTDPAKLPVRVKIFSIAEVVSIICDTYFSDYKDITPRPDKDAIAEHTAAVAGMRSTRHSIMCDDDIYTIKEYLERHFADNAFVQNLSNSDYWDTLAENIDTIDGQLWVKAFAILWNNHPQISEIFSISQKFLGSFGYQQLLYVSYTALLRESGVSIINVQTRNSFFETERTFDAQSEDGKVIKADAAKLSFLTAEIILPVSQSSVENRPFIKDVDIIDFPGARSRPEVHQLERGSLLEMMLRGKVSYLFNHYSSHYKSNVLAVCMRTSQTDVTTVPRLVNQWISDNIGNTPKLRGQNLKGELCPLFVIFTWWNTQLLFKEATDSSDPTERIEKLFDTRFRQEILGDNEWHQKWIETGGKADGFKNFYLLRDFKESTEIFKADGTSEAVTDTFLNESKAEFYRAYKEKFLAFHNTPAFFENPQLNFDEASTPNKDGSELIIRNLIPVANDSISLPVYINNLNHALTTAKAELEKHHHSDDKDDQIKAAARDASDLQLRMDVVFGKDAFYFGSFIEQIMITERDIREFYHELLKSDKLIRKKNTNTYVLIRMHNPGLGPELSDDENLEILRHYYNLDNLDATRKRLTEVEGIDLDQLVRGDAYDLQNNSIILAEEARNYWKETRLNPARFNRFEELGFEKKQLQKLFDAMVILYDRLNLSRTIAAQIRDYVDVQKRIDDAEDMISHITAGIINEFVTSVGWTFMTNNEKDQLRQINEVYKFNLPVDKVDTPFQAIEKVTDTPGAMSIDKLIDYMENLNENLSRKPVDTAVIPYVPMIKNYVEWINQMKMAFLLNCDIPTYDVEANKKLGTLLAGLRERNF